MANSCPIVILGALSTNGNDIPIRRNRDCKTKPVEVGLTIDGDTQLTPHHSVPAKNTNLTRIHPVVVVERSTHDNRIAISRYRDSFPKLT